MSVLAWVNLTVCLWLLRKAVKATGWLLMGRGRDRGVAGHARADVQVGADASDI